MRIECIDRELSENQRTILKAPSRFRPNHRITVGREYLVLGMVSVTDSPQYGNATLFEIINDDGQFVLFPAVLFKVTDGRCSSLWRAMVKQDGTVTLRPEELCREFFRDDLSEGDPVSRKVFETVVAKLETEFRSQAPASG